MADWEGRLRLLSKLPELPGEGVAVVAIRDLREAMDEIDRLRRERDDCEQRLLLSYTRKSPAATGGEGVTEPRDVHAPLMVGIPWYAAWPPRPPSDDEACPTCGYGLDDGSGCAHECPPGFLLGAST